MHIFTHIISIFICCLLLAKVLNLDYVVQPLNFEQPNLTPDTVHDGTWSALISNQQISKSDLNNISLINFSKRNRTIKHDILVLTYLCNLLFLNSYAPEPKQVQQQSTHVGHAIKLLPGNTKLSFVTVTNCLFIFYHLITFILASLITYDKLEKSI